MLIEKTGGHILRNIDCKTQRGGAMKEVLKANNSID